MLGLNTPALARVIIGWVLRVRGNICILESKYISRTRDRVRKIEGRVDIGENSLEGVIFMFSCKDNTSRIE